MEEIIRNDPKMKLLEAQKAEIEN